ncbi:MAG: hypothetical protein QOH93_2737 [Chloroflexia bacterium]|jgi:hypothetical protein|nr:hypothetical protein [Chloroflexia bacterium]
MCVCILYDANIREIEYCAGALYNKEIVAESSR